MHHESLISAGVLAALVLLFSVRGKPVAAGRVATAKLNIAGLNADILGRCSIATQQRFAHFGTALLATSMFAAMTGAYSASLVTDWASAAMIGGIWGAFVLTLDRLILAELVRSPSAFGAPALLRLVLAVAISAFTGQVAALAIFAPEVRQQLSTAHRARTQAEERALAEDYERETAPLQALLGQREADARDAHSAARAASENALGEADGTGGSGRRGLSRVYDAKAQAAERLQRHADALDMRVRETLDALTTLANEQRVKERALAAGPVADGLLARVQALRDYAQDKPQAKLLMLLIWVLGFALEGAPVLLKLLSKSSELEMRLRAHEAELAALIEQQSDAIQRDGLEEIKAVEQAKAQERARQAAERSAVDRMREDQLQAALKESARSVTRKRRVSALAETLRAAVTRTPSSGQPDTKQERDVPNWPH